METKPSLTTRSCPSTSSTPICWARKACSKYALLCMPGVSTTTVGSSAVAGALARSASSSMSGEQAHHHLAVFQHVAHAAGHTQVVFEHVVLALRIGRAHDIDAGDMRVDVL